MYHNNNYSGDGGGGNFPNFINQNNFPPFAGSPTGQPSLQQQGGIKYYEEPNGMMDTSNEYQPELPMFNQQAFMQNGFNAQVSDSSKIGTTLLATQHSALCHTSICPFISWCLSDADHSTYSLPTLRHLAHLPHLPRMPP